VKLVTIPDVPLVSTGSYLLSTGPHTFTEEELAAAVAALGDPAVKSPRVKIDGLQGFDDPEAHGGEPAFGHIENMRLTADAQTIVGDLKVPAWLADSIEWAYPARSIEGSLGVQTATGKTHELIVTAVALLGVELPGVSTLPDLQELLSAEGPAPERDVVLASAPSGGRRLEASLDQDLVRRRFYDLVEGGELDLPEGVVGYDLWVRSMRFDDDGKPYLKVQDEGNATLYRVDFTVDGSDVTFGDFVEVVEQDVPVAAASEAVRSEPLAIFASRAESRAVPSQSTTQEGGMTPEQIRRLRIAAGVDETALPDNPTPEQVDAALAKLADASPTGDERTDGEPNENAGAGADVGGGGADTTSTEAPANDQETEPASVAATAALPEGVVAIDRQTLTELQAGAKTATELKAEGDRKDRDDTIKAAIGAGKFAPSRRKHFERLWAKDPDGTKHMLTASEADGGLAPGLVPVTETGGAPQENDLAGDPGYDPAWLPPHVQQRIAAAQQGIPTGAGGARIVREA
jgi:hypothetical protein